MHHRLDQSLQHFPKYNGSQNFNYQIITYYNTIAALPLRIIHQQRPYLTNYDIIGQSLHHPNKFLHKQKSQITNISHTLVTSALP